MNVPRGALWVTSAQQKERVGQIRRPAALPPGRGKHREGVWHRPDPYCYVVCMLTGAIFALCQGLLTRRTATGRTAMGEQ